MKVFSAAGMLKSWSVYLLEVDDFGRKLLGKGQAMLRMGPKHDLSEFPLVLDASQILVGEKGLAP